MKISNFSTLNSKTMNNKNITLQIIQKEIKDFEFEKEDSTESYKTYQKGYNFFASQILQLLKKILQLWIFI